MDTSSRVPTEEEFITKVWTVANGLIQVRSSKRGRHYYEKIAAYFYKMTYQFNYIHFIENS